MTAQRAQRRAIGWGAGGFLGIGIGGALALALDDPLLGLLVAIGITLAVAGIYLAAGYASAERRAATIAARSNVDDEEEDDDGTY